MSWKWNWAIGGWMLAACLFAATAQAQVEAERILLQTDDEQTLAADWFAQPGNLGSPTAVLIHNQGSTHNAWQPFLPHLFKAGFQVLTIDLRGHGDSKATTPEVHARMVRRENEPYLEMIRDVEAAVRWVTNEAKVAPERIVLIGGAHGANLAIQAGADNDKIGAVVAISPSRHFFNFPLMEHAEKYGDRPLFLIITKQYLSRGGTDIQKLNENNESFEMKVFPRYELHGTQLLNLSWDIEGRVIKWLSVILDLESS